MDPVHQILLALIAGLALIVAEIFLPTGGTFTILSGASLIFSCVMAWRTWSDSALIWVFYGFVLFAIPATVVGTLYIMPYTKFGNKILLEAPKTEDVTPDIEVQAKLHELIGALGKTTTPVRPGGMVEVNGERFHCESRGLLIERGTEVEVIAVKGNRLVIRRPNNEPTDITGTQAKTKETDGTDESVSEAATPVSADDAKESPVPAADSVKPDIQERPKPVATLNSQSTTQNSEPTESDVFSDDVKAEENSQKDASSTESLDFDIPTN